MLISPPWDERHQEYFDTFNLLKLQSAWWNSINSILFEKRILYICILFFILYIRWQYTIFIAQHNMATYSSSNKTWEFPRINTSALMIKNWCVAVGLFWWRNIFQNMRLLHSIQSRIGVTVLQSHTSHTREWIGCD